MVQLIYEFSIVLREAEVSESDCNALYEAGCSDGTIVTRNGQTFIAFDREASSLEEAIRSASRDVRAAGFQIDHIEMDVLV